MEEKDILKKTYQRGLRRGIIGTVIVCAVIILAGGALLSARTQRTRVAITATEDGEQVQKIQTYDSVLDRDTVNKINYLAANIQAQYYEDVDAEELKEGLFQGLFDVLDEYSQYYTKEEYEELFNTSIAGNYSGIGATLQQDSKTKQVTVVSVQEDSPAEKAGIQVDDIIVKADDYKATEMELSDFVSHLKGEEGTSVHVTIYRESENRYLEMDITRKKLDISTVQHVMLQDQTGYIRITEFMENTTGQFEDALEDLKQQGMTGLIVDLRNNPGGMLSSVTDILEDIVPEGMIVYTEDKYNNRQEYLSTGENTLQVPLVVLVNENSASASEIFAGAVKDRECGTLVGTTTFGKGIVQGLKKFQDGSAMKLTTSRYYTPDGVCIQGKGIEPDVELEYEFLGTEDQSYDYSLDNQIQKALEILKSQQ